MPKISPQRVHRIGLHVYTSLRTGVIIQVARKFSQSKRYDKFPLVEKIVWPIKTLIQQISHVKNIVCSKIRIFFHRSIARKSLLYIINVGYFMVDECVRFSFTSCE